MKLLIEHKADFTKEIIPQYAASMLHEDILEYLNEKQIEETNWKHWKKLLKAYVSDTPLAKLNIYLFAWIA